MPQVRESRKYEDKSNYNKNRLAQPLGHGLFVRPGPSHEGGVKRIRSESPHNGHGSDDYLKNPACQDLLPLCSPA
jgi:hypothetical protein